MTKLLFCQKGELKPRFKLPFALLAYPQISQIWGKNSVFEKYFP